MNKGLLLFFTTLFCSISVLGQERTFKELYTESISYLEVGSFGKALPILLEMFEMDKANASTAFLIGGCYMNTENEKPLAIPYFELAKEKLTVEYRAGYFKEKSAPLEVIRYLGQAYHVNYEFEKALEEYKIYRGILNKNNLEDWEAVTHDIRMSRNAIDLKSRPVNVIIESVDVLNTEYAEYRPKVNAEETFMYFTTRRNGELNLLDDENKYFEDIYYSVKENGEWTEAVKIGDSISTDSHDACLYLSPDGQMMYVYQFDGGEDAGGSIYESRLIGEKWTKPEKLIADINSEYWETDASLNTSGNTIFFTSDRPGGTGQNNRDIWMMRKLPSGEWARIQPLSSSINTIYDEESPYLHADGKTLYFSSKGHNTMGGYDVFSSELLNDGSWSEAVNLGYPINTTGDDVFYFPSVDGKTAYFSSYREGGKGEQDIYKSTYDQGEPGSFAIYKGIAKNDEGNVIDNLRIYIFDVDLGEEYGEYRPNKETGKFLFVLEAGKTYEINYETNESSVKEIIKVDAAGGITIIKNVTEHEGALIVTNFVEDTIADAAVIVDNSLAQADSGAEEVAVDSEAEEVAVDSEAEEVAEEDIAIVAGNVFTQTEINTTLNTGDMVAINSVMFIYDQVKLIEESQPELDKIVNYMNQYKDAKLVINGHTDSKGEADYNYWLSSARANKIRNYLRKAGINYSRMETHGYGESRPVADNENADGSDNTSGRQKNRRVEFTVNK